MVSEERFQPKLKEQFTPNKPTQLDKTSTTNETQTYGSTGGTPSIMSLVLRGESYVKIAVFSLSHISLGWLLILTKKM